MIGPSRTMPCFGYPVPLRFPDVDPDVLAREDASDRGASRHWPAFLWRVLGAIESSPAGHADQPAAG